MPSTDFEKEKNAFRAYYHEHSKLLTRAAEDFRSLVYEILNNQIEIDKVTARVKDLDGCIEKFDKKYRETLEKENKPYEISPYITDLIGVRVVCLYEPDVINVEAILKKHFACVGETDKTAKIEEQESSFGYKGVHLDVKLRQKHVKIHPPFERYEHIQFELQIRTISQDAWSTIDHRIKYKKNIPHQLKRRINRLAALFELADQEFVRIRAAARAELARGEKMAKAPQGSDPGPLDVFSFLGVVGKAFPGENFEEKASDEFLQAVKQLDPDFTAKGLSDTLSQNLPKVEVYRTDNKINLKPFTKIRYALFLKNRDKFAGLLLPSQRKVFEPWLEQQNAGSLTSPPKSHVSGAAGRSA